MLLRSCYCLGATSALLVPLAHGFQCAPLMRSSRIQKMRTSSVVLHHSDGDSVSAGFDYSSKAEWDNFYETGQGGFEWHSALSLETIASYIPEHSKCLMVGSGDSGLPAVTLTTRENVQVTLLDNSKVCMDQMEELYGDAVKCQCGDATKLTNYFDQGEGAAFDIIVDKGLTDALLCSEGWDFYVEQLLQGSSKILKSGSGKYLLITYRLPKSHQEFLQEIGDRSDVGLKWDFNLDHSTEKISISMANKV